MYFYFDLAVYGSGTGQHQMWKGHFSGYLAGSCKLYSVQLKGRSRGLEKLCLLGVVLFSNVINLRRAISVHSWGCTVQYKLYVFVASPAWSCMGRIAYPACCHLTNQQQCYTCYQNVVLFLLHSQKEKVWGCIFVAFIQRQLQTELFCFKISIICMHF